jgi:hypothetical protein
MVLIRGGGFCWTIRFVSIEDCRWYFVWLGLSGCCVHLGMAMLRMHLLNQSRFLSIRMVPVD